MASSAQTLKNEDTDSTCGVRNGIRCFIDSEAGICISKFGMKLDDEIVEVRMNKKKLPTYDSREQPFDNMKGISCNNSNNGDSDGNESGNSSDSGTTRDCADGRDGVEIIKGIKITDIERGTYCHGFGLRDDDIILSVNDRPVTSAAWVFIVVKRIIERSKTSKLKMEIHRKEKGLIVLDNGGDDLYDWDDDELIRIDSSTNRIKSVRFRGGYLIVKRSNESIALSNFRTRERDKLFQIRQYLPSVLREEPEKKLVTLEHKATGKYLWVDDGIISLKDPPSGDGKTLPADSNYIFNMIHPNSSAIEIFQSNNDSGQAMGFESRRSSATLMAATNRETFFNIFTADSC